MWTLLSENLFWSMADISFSILFVNVTLINAYFSSQKWQKLLDDSILIIPQQEKEFHYFYTILSLIYTILSLISSLQLIPINIIAYRSQYGSTDPAAIVGPAITVTMARTLAAVVFCKVMDR